MFFIGFLILVALVVVWAIARYNGLVTLRNQVQNGWKQIDVQLKRRHDLIPNLVNTVKGAMQFEQETLEKVIQARNAAVGAADSRGGVAGAGAAEDGCAEEGRDEHEGKSDGEAHVPSVIPTGR